MPAPSSFRTPPAAGATKSWATDECLILSPAEAAMHAAALVFVPAMTYVGTHWQGLTLVHVRAQLEQHLFTLELNFSKFRTRS